MAKMNKNANYVTEKRQVASQASAKAKSSKKIKEGTKQGFLIAAIVVAIAVVIAAFVGLVFLKPYFEMKNNQREFLNPNEGHFEVTDVVELEFEGYGKVTVELYGKEAPKTVENFLHLVEEGAITAEKIAISSSTTDKHITIQADHDHSDPDHKHVDIKGEFYDNGFANKIAHVSGVLTMANGSTKFNSSSTDFKIITDGEKYNVERTDGSYKGHNGNYAAFGKVDSEGLKVIEQIITDYRAKADTATTDKNALVFGSNKISVTTSDITKKTIEKTFTPASSGTYVFKSTKYTSILVDLVKEGAASGAKAAGFGETITTLKDGVSYDLVAGQAYTVTLGLGDDLKAGTHILTIEGDLLFAGSNDIEITEEDIKAESVSYAFTPNYTGIYFFDCQTTVKDKTFKGTFEIFDGETSVGKKSAYLEKGKTYTFIINVKENVEADDYKVVVTDPTLVTGDNKLSVPEYTIRDGKAYYYFKPSADAKYLFNNKDLTVKVYDTEGNEVAGGNYVELKKDVTYKIEISAELDPLMGLGDTNVVITADHKKGDNSYEEEFSFTAEATGKYTFTEDNVTIDVWDGTKKLEKGEDGTYSLKVGTTYDVIVKAIAEGNYTVNVKVDDAKDEDDVIVYASYTLTVQAPSLVVGANKLTVTEADVKAEKVEYTFTATTSGMFSFKGIYQKLDENGKQATDKDGKLINVNAKLTFKDKDGKEVEVDMENVKLVKGETYTIVLKSVNIKKDAVATITVAKVSPKIIGATIVEK